MAIDFQESHDELVKQVETLKKMTSVISSLTVKNETLRHKTKAIKAAFIELKKMKDELVAMQNQMPFAIAQTSCDVWNENAVKIEHTVNSLVEKETGKLFVIREHELKLEKDHELGRLNSRIK